ncbi:predicted protein, partial [Nematostella vectensis]
MHGLTTISTTPENLVAAVFVAILMFFTLFGNIIVISCFYTFQDLRTICNYFVVSLSVADILVALVAMPFWLHVQVMNNMWTLSRTLRRFWDCIDILCGTASIMNLTAVSIDRMLAIAVPFRYPHILTPKRAVALIICVWGYAMSVGGARVTDWPGRSFLYFVSVVCFFFPLTIVIIMYIVIFVVVRIQVKRIGKNSIVRASEMKAAKTIAVVIGGFLICWLPFFTMVLGYAYDPSFDPPFALFNVIKWLEYFNSCLNPLIYACMNRLYRRAFRRLFKRCYLR